MPSAFASPLSAHWGVGYATPAAETGFLEGFSTGGPTRRRPRGRRTDIQRIGRLLDLPHVCAGAVYVRGGPGRIWRALSYSVSTQVFEFVRRDFRPSYEFGTALSTYLARRFPLRLTCFARDPPPPVLRTGGGKAAVGCLPMRSRGRWIADVVSETEGDGEVWLRCFAAVGSLKVSCVSSGRAGGMASVPITGLRRRIIWRVAATLDTSIANRRSVASIQRSSGDGVTSPVCVCLCRVMGAIVRALRGRSDLGRAILQLEALER